MFFSYKTLLYPLNGTELAIYNIGSGEPERRGLFYEKMGFACRGSRCARGMASSGRAVTRQTREQCQSSAGQCGNAEFTGCPGCEYSGVVCLRCCTHCFVRAQTAPHEEIAEGATCLWERGRQHLLRLDVYLPPPSSSQDALHHDFLPLYVDKYLLSGHKEAPRIVA